MTTPALTGNVARLDAWALRQGLRVEWSVVPEPRVGGESLYCLLFKGLMTVAGKCLTVCGRAVTDEDRDATALAMGRLLAPAKS